MATVTSVGAHKPSALSLLILEGVLPPEPQPETYIWQTWSVSGHNHETVEEELLSTEKCVVWSRAGIVQRIFRFDVEDEPVIQALFASFPNQPKDRNIDDEYEVERLHQSLRFESAYSQPKNTYTSTKKPYSKKLVENSSNQSRCTPPTDHGSSPESRALVVVFKTQILLFFLTGTSHVVHLPIEVDSAQPLPKGVLLQRKRPIHNSLVVPTPQLPSAPQNTFVFSQSSVSRSYDDNPMSRPGPGYSPSSLLSDVYGKLESSSNKSSPGLYCLLDPLAEIGCVVTDLMAPKKNKDSTLKALNSNERILYVSSKDELLSDNAASSGKKPLHLAVTVNTLNGKVSIWRVSYLTNKKSKARRWQKQDTLPNRSRRQSSRGRGISTGAMTPVPLLGTSGRESTGIVQSFRGQDLTQDDANFSNNIGDPLELAFGSPEGARKSSRRVSSLLARSDLAASHDRTTFTEFPTVSGKRISKRGQPFGVPAQRPSLGLDGGLIAKSQAINEIRSSLDSVSLSQSLALGAPIGSTAQGFQQENEVDGSADLKPGLLKELCFHRVHMSRNPIDGLFNVYPESKPRVFVMRLPQHSLESSAGDGTLFISIAVPKTEETLVLKMSPSESYQEFEFLAPGKRSIHPWDHGVQVHESVQSNVIDAQPVGEGTTKRTLVIRRSASGTNTLALQVPWSTEISFRLPTPLNIVSKFRINQDRSTRGRQEVGLRRVMSHSPNHLMSLEHPDETGAVDVADSNGLLHRLRLQLRPRSRLVQQIVDFCEAVLPNSDSDREVILRGWWDVMQWLHSEHKEDENIEWTAIVVVLFTMAVPFLPDNNTHPVTNQQQQQRKRKNGIFRSPSGSYADPETWDAMLDQEHDLIDGRPHWMGGAWERIASDHNKSHQGSKSKPKSPAPHSWPQTSAAAPLTKKSSALLHCLSIARTFAKSPAGQLAMGPQGYLPTATSWDLQIRRTALPSILIALHLLREELKLDILAGHRLHQLTPLLAQLGGWLDWQNWGFREGSHYLLESRFLDGWLFDNSIISGLPTPTEPCPPPSIFAFIERRRMDSSASFLSLLEINNVPDSNLRDGMLGQGLERRAALLTPRTFLICQLYRLSASKSLVEDMMILGMSISMLETLPEGVAVKFRTALLSCQSEPSLNWDSKLLKQIGREDLIFSQALSTAVTARGVRPSIISTESLYDTHSICHAAFDVEVIGPYDGSAETDRQGVTRLLFRNDQRFAEAAKLLHPLLYPVASCAAEADWSDTELLEAQQELAKIVAMRTLSVSLGRGLLFYNARMPLLTEKFPIHGFTLSCVMKPSDTTVTADRTIYTEEKVSWAFFHAGVEAGLSISKEAKGVNTSWILFNKARDLNNRHAGFLLAMGLNGHLKSIAKWLAFKYLTPKHSMTSTGLLLGLSASYLGTMDTTITRLLSVHITRMLPPGAADLNLSPMTQTAGLMGVGLLYCKTQHRRMSEIMLSEMENLEDEYNTNPRESLRDEGYRLAAGFALGFINLGQGKDLKGLHDMQVTKRLLALAVAPKEPDHVHILDRSTTGATIAIALIFMKTGNEALARKINIPDTVHQFESVRPDHFLLRTVARHVIMWDGIRATFQWIKHHISPAYRHRSDLTTVRSLTSEDLPFFNIVAGLCFAIGLRYAGSGSIDVRNLLVHYLHHLARLCRLPTLNYDGKLTRITVRNCQDLVGLAAACVMAGTGDIQIFRYLRCLHGRTDTETPYGSHLATHFAIGILFLGGGTHTFGTTDVAIGSLLCAFYPLLPSSVLDNKSHLQAFRHLWVLAVESRCLVVREIETQCPISAPVSVTLKTGTESIVVAPCLLPELSTIEKLKVETPEFWPVILNLNEDASKLEALKHHQNVFVRRRSAHDAHSSAFSATMQALNDAQIARHAGSQRLSWILNLPAFSLFDRASQEIVLPSDHRSSARKGIRNTSLDDGLMLEKVCTASSQSERLWNVRILLSCLESITDQDGKSLWITKERVERLKAALAIRRQMTKTFS